MPDRTRDPDARPPTGAEILVLQAAGARQDERPELVVTGPAAVLPSRFDVTGLAVGACAAAGLAASRLHAIRTGAPARSVHVDSRAACAAFAAEALFTPVGWPRPDLWDPIAGTYRTADGWARLHTNYPHHRRVAEVILGATEREEIRRRCATWRAADLESAIVDGGGCAAAMHDRAGWLASAPGRATADEPAVTRTARAGDGRAPRWEQERPRQPFSGIRVLDLTRVIAGPDCTKFLAGYGADVLRVDPPGFPEVESLLPETTVGKRVAGLDLTSKGDRAVFEDLLRGADVLVSSYRGDVLARLGYADDALSAINNDLITASLTAYGWRGPWRHRRGFDSLVQVSCGVVEAGMTWRAGTEPSALPVQALDHGAGHLLAAAVADALAARSATGAVSQVRASLIGVANLLWTLPEPGSRPERPDLTRFTLVEDDTVWGPARRAPLGALVDGVDVDWPVPAGPLGRHAATW